MERIQLFYPLIQPLMLSSLCLCLYPSAADPILLLLSNGFPVDNFSSSCDFGLCHEGAS